jgi:hypothetical protein
MHSIHRIGNVWTFVDTKTDGRTYTFSLFNTKTNLLVVSAKRRKEEENDDEWCWFNSTHIKR